MGNRLCSGWLSQHRGCFFYSLTLSVLQWYTLNDVKSGRVRLILEWVPTRSLPARLDKVHPKWRIQLTRDVCPAATAWLNVCLSVCVAGAAASGSSVISEQSCSCCSAALCPHRASTFITCKSSWQNLTPRKKENRLLLQLNVNSCVVHHS